jgi:hypothetical protein
MTKFDESRLTEEQRGYIIGLFLGDGSFNRGKKEPRFFVRFALDAKRDEDIAFRLSEIMNNAGKKTNLFLWQSNIIAKVCSKELVTFIQNYITYDQKGKTFENCEG